MAVSTISLGKVKFNWRGNWTVNTAYVKDDVVKYGANVYIVTVSHTSGSLFASNSAKFDVMANGVTFAGSYNPATAYKLNDIVTYGNGAYIALQETTGNTPGSSPAYWSAMLNGVQYEGVYNSSTVYQIGDIVNYGGNNYVAIQNTTNNLPTNNIYWNLYNQGFSFQGTFSLATAYKIGQVVSYGAKTYIATQDSTGNIPTNTTYWQQLSEGQINVGIYNGSTAYRPGDLAQYGGYIYVCITASTGNAPSNATYWTQTQTGFVWSGTYFGGSNYQKGEVVNYNGSSFVSTSFDNLNNTPDVSVSVWSVMMQGSANNVYTTPGDLAYRNTATIVRLPTGANGQVLTVGANGLPVWENNGYSNNVYYVSQNGVDAAGYGTTLERPFASLQYATQNCASTSTIFVKAGTYYEQLPITVPTNVAIIGDSTRTTFIAPKSTGVSLDASPVANSSSTMFLLGDGTLLRNFSMTGMTGFNPSSTATNDITKATIGGVFVRFNPAVPIVYKSPYVLDCSAFSTSGVGALLDGSVHNSGIKSMVFHAFTNVHDNGVGFWVKDNAKAEIVSCFTYYCYFGYATTGGAKIRALNGNNSYGTYGVVSRGYDVTESPLTCTLYGNQLTYNSNSLSGTGFTTSDVITGLISGARGTITNVQSAAYKVYYKSISGTFIAGETITGSVSGSSAVIATGGVTGQKGFVLIVTGLASAPVIGTSIELTGDDSAYVIQSAGTWVNSSSIVPIILAQEKATESTDGTAVRIRTNFSQSRLTGHDFLSVGTGGKTTTNYPGLPTQSPSQGNETVEVFPGRVFFITTDQDGNFRVGKYFAVNQATGQATLNANAFNLSGLSALRLGSIGAQLGELISEFSSDVTLGSDSNTKVPTQHAVKAYVDTKVSAGSAYIGTTLVSFNRASGSLTLSGVNIDGIAGSATTATTLVGGAAGQLPYQINTGTTGFVTAGTSGTVLVSNGTGAPTFQNTLSLSSTATSTSTTTGALVVSGGVGVGGNLVVGGNVTVTGSLSASGVASTGKAIAMAMVFG